jgi:hypothetical protein
LKYNTYLEEFRLSSNRLSDTGGTTALANALYYNRTLPDCMDGADSMDGLNEILTVLPSKPKETIN